MKEEIQGIVKAISQLSPPFIPYELKKILAALDGLKNITIPCELASLNDLVEAQSVLYGTKAQIKELCEKLDSLAADVKTINKQLKGSDSLKSGMEPIIKSINEYLTNQKLTPITLPINLQNKETKEQVNRYLQHIQVLIEHFEVHTLIDDLAMVKVHCARESSTEHIKKLIKKTQSELEKLRNACSRIDNINQQLLVNIPVADAQKKRQQIKVALGKVNAEFENKKTDTETFPDLDYYKKNKLIQQADTTFFNPDLIKFYNSKSKSSASSWLPSFEPGNSSKSQESIYLELLNEKNELTLKKNTLDLLNELLNPSSFNPLKTDMAEDVSNLIKEVSGLFEAVNQSLVSLLPDTAASIDVFNLFHTKTLLDVRVKQKEYILDTLGKLLAIRQNMLSLDKATLLPAPDENLDDTLDKDTLIEHRTLCLSFLKGLKILDPLFSVQQEKADAEAKLRSLSSFESTNEQIRANDRRIVNAITRLSELNPVTTNDTGEMPLENAAPQKVENTDTGRTSPLSPMDMEDEGAPPSPILLPADVNLKRSTDKIRDRLVATPLVKAPSFVPASVVHLKLTIDSQPVTPIAAPIPEPVTLTNPNTVSFIRDTPQKVQAIALPTPAQPSVMISPTVNDKKPTPQKDDRAMDLQSLTCWHQQNLAFLKEGPEIARQWYVDLYQTVESYIKQNPICYRPYHLIHDIYLGLGRKDKLRTIKCYMQLCPTPKEIEHLLLFKPNFRIQPLDELTILQNSPTGLKPLCSQYERLKKHYPIESALLLQAIQALSIAKEFMASPSARQSALIPLLTEDPFYEPLKKHRGFLRVWELLERFLNALLDVFRPETESTYIQSSCFFKTRTARLLLEAGYSITHDPSILNSSSS